MRTAHELKLCCINGHKAKHAGWTQQTETTNKNTTGNNTNWMQTESNKQKHWHNKQFLLQPQLLCSPRSCMPHYAKSFKTHASPQQHDLSCAHRTSKVQHTTHVWNRTCDYLSNPIEGRHATTKDEDGDRHLALWKGLLTLRLTRILVLFGPLRICSSTWWTTKSTFLAPWCFFAGIKKEKERADLIAFLSEAA